MWWGGGQKKHFAQEKGTRLRGDNTGHCCCVAMCLSRRPLAAKGTKKETQFPLSLPLSLSLSLRHVGAENFPPALSM